MVSTFRLYLIRVVYLMIFIFLTSNIWPGIIHHAKTWSLMNGVAHCLLAAMAPLFLLGLRYPLRMLPVFLFELSWKSIWLVAIGIPLWSAHQMDADTAETFKACAIGVVLCVIAIPWGYVFANFVKSPGDRWKRESTIAA